jgi:hypothetical protein
MTTEEKLAKLKSQLVQARAMIGASDPKAGESEQRAAAGLIQRVKDAMAHNRCDEAASVARELYRAVLKFQAAWATGQSSATGRALTQVETLAAEIEVELRAFAQKKP